MTYMIGALVIVGLLVGMILMMVMGRRLGNEHRRAHSGSDSGLGGVEGAVFGLMGLMVAFTFSGAAERFDNRRHLIVEEANAIGTAYLRVDLLPPAAQPSIRQLFRDYVDKRLAVYRAIPDIAAAKSLLAESAELQNRIWTESVAACRTQEMNGNAVTSLVASSLNSMIDITTTRTVALQTHPPAPIYAMLAVMVLAGALFIGYQMGFNGVWSRVHTISFAVLLSASLYIIFDLEFPRVGFIRIDFMDQLLVDVRQGMK